MKQKSINGLAWSVMWRIIVVIAYYFLLILLSILILVSVYFFSIYLFWPLLSYMRGFYIFMVIVAWAGLCCLAVMFAVFLVKPLFSSSESTEIDNTIEIEREDCPALFDVITDVVKQTGTKMPKHVYLSPYDNACVFFDSSFWSIFLPIKKNLKIGLGLFNGLSVEEIKSIIAHEFGHFSQGSMKVGSSVYVINQVLYNMTYERDGWDDLIDSWSTTDSDSWIANVFAFWGVLTRKLTDWVKRGNEMMYKFVHQKYMELSRQMEYDADNISCKCVGKECFISAMYKTDINSRNLRFFANIMKDLIAEKKKVRNIFDAIEITNNTYYKDDSTLIRYDHPLEKYLLVESRIRVNDARSSHPLLADRIKNANNNTSKEAVKPIPAWNLVPKEIAIQVSGVFYWDYEDYMKCQEISNDDYTSWLNQYLPQHYMPNEITPFFGRHIIPFELTIPHENVEYPFTQQNRQLVNEYLVTQRDWDFISKIQNHEIDTKNLYINGGSLNVLDFPVDDYKKHLSELSSQVCDLDRQVYQYLFLHCKEEDKERLDSSYNLLFYAENTIDGCLSSLINLSNQAKGNLNEIFYTYGGFKEEVVYDLVEKYVINFNKLLKEIDPVAIDFVRDKGYLIDLQGSLAAYTEKENLSKTEYLNLILVKLPQELIDIHNQLIVISQKSLSDIAQDIINGNKEVKENPDVKAPIFTSNIETITIDHIEDTENAGLVVLLIASILALVLIIAYFFVNPRETVVKTESEVETTTPSYPNSGDANDPVEQMKQKKDLVLLSLIADIQRNTRVRFYIPNGLSHHTLSISDDKYPNGYEIKKEELFPPYRVFVYTKNFLGAFGDDEIEVIVEDYEKRNDLRRFVNESNVNMYKINQETFCYTVKRKYDTIPQKLVDFHVVHPSGDSFLVYVIYEREEEQDNPVETILKTMEFRYYHE